MIVRKNMKKRWSKKKQDHAIVVVNFADENYKSTQCINTISALLIGKADIVYSFSPDDIDRNFYEKNKVVLEKKRGAGMWLWKPYFVNMILSEIKEGDYLFYCDSGAFFIRSIKKIVERTIKDDILCCDIPLIEEQFTKKYTFEFVGGMSEKYAKTNQIIGTYFMIRKNSFTVNFVKEWLDLCCEGKYLLPSDGKYEVENFISHREDQSIFSLLCKKYGIEPYRDISQRRWFPYSYKYNNCEFRIHSYQKYTPVILYLHKMNKVKIKSIIAQILHYIKSQIWHNAE